MTFLGLFSFWLILFIVLTGYLHIRLFFLALKMSNDSEKQPQNVRDLREQLLGRARIDTNVRNGADEENRIEYARSQTIKVTNKEVPKRSVESNDN